MRRLWYAQIISVFGDFLALFAVISVLTFRLHANARQVTGVQMHENHLRAARASI